jgi:hypothetical protein
MGPRIILIQDQLHKDDAGHIKDQGDERLLEECPQITFR